MKEHFYLCAKEGVFGKDCQITSVAKGDDLALIAQRWGAVNGYDNVFVFNINHQFMFSTDKRNDMIKQFHEFKKKHPDALMLFRCGDFYECYEEDAVKANELLGVTVTKHKDGYKMAMFPHHALDIYLPNLIRAGNRISICDKLELPKRKR